MFLRRLKPDVMTLSFGGLIVLLMLAAIFMHRAINRASEGERREKQEQLDAALHSVVKDFAAALRDVPDLNGEAKPPAQLEGWISEQYQRWRSKTSQPEIIRSVSIGTLATNNQTEYSRLDKAAFTKAEWPETLAAMRADLLARANNNALQPMTPGAIAQFQTSRQFFIALPLTVGVTIPPPVMPKPPSLAKLQLPQFGPPGGGRPPRGRPPFGLPPFAPPRPGEGRQGPPEEVLQQRMEARKKAEGEFRKEVEKIEQTARKEQLLATQRAKSARPIEQLAGYFFLELDDDYLQKQVLPNLIAQHFKTGELSNYDIAAVLEPEQQTFFATNAKVALASFDAQEILFQNEAKAWRGVAPASPNKLTLRTQHKAGSLQAVIDRTRWRNLALGYGGLLLLFAAALSLLIATQRARTLAQRQMEFVAGVTHELRTPLTAIQAAGFNLSSGRVNDADRVKQYGTMIHTEGRRLADLIDQVLSYASIEASKKSGEASYNFQPLQVNEVIEQALSEYHSAFADWHIEKNIEAALPPVLADANVLGNAVKNLLQNALKYAAQGKWLRIEAARVNDEVQITVADHGPGIERRDLPHIFAPFYRAQKMVASAVPGTGLGLSLVSEYMKAHHGRVTVASTAGNGAAFTLHLPINATNGKPA